MANKSLVIVESPSKAKTIGKYLGSEYLVKSSVGHVRRLTSGKKAIDPKDWSVSYEIDPKKTKVVQDLKKSAKGIDEVFLATDLDREGEAIAWHLKEILGKKHNYKRVRFNEITKSAIKKAFEDPTNLNDGLIDAQKTRRILDRIVGYDLSAFLWGKLGSYGKLSAGRVQSVAVKLVVEKEKEISQFCPEEYWEIEVKVKHEERNITFKLNVKKSDVKLSNIDEAEQISEKLLNNKIEITDNDKTKRKIPVKPPFITSTLQQTSSSMLGYSLSKTMKIAQDLYASGYISYMRTDSPNLSILSQNNCKQYLLEKFGDTYSEPRNFSAKTSNSQEAHEAIRPTDINLEPDQITMSADHVKLYRLIWQRFAASQMPQPEIETNAIKAKCDDLVLETSLSSVTFDGFYKVMPPPKSSYVDYDLSSLRIGTSKKIDEVEKSQHFTNPPSRFSEASLVKELEKRGIGRPSTYQEIITNIQARGYVRSESKRLFATPIAHLISDRLTKGFSKIMDYSFTANMEKNLDEIASGDLTWRNVLENFSVEFTEAKDSANDKTSKNVPITTDVLCESCGVDRKMDLITKPASNEAASKDSGQWLGCTGFAINKCKNSHSLISEELVAENDDKEAEKIFGKSRCEKCGSIMNGFIIDNKRKLEICALSPICDGTKLIEGDFIKPKNEDEEFIDCHKCDNKMELKLGRFGKYFACQSDSCTATRQLMKNGELKPVFMDPIKLESLRCEKCDDFYLLRDSLKGLFLAASQFPKNRETRAITVNELKVVTEKLPEKYSHFAKAPEVDDDGDDLVVRFNKKSGDHLLSAELKGKKKKYFYFFNGSSWEHKPRD